MEIYFDPVDEISLKMALSRITTSLQLRQVILKESYHRCNDYNQSGNDKISTNWGDIRLVP